MKHIKKFSSISTAKANTLVTPLVTLVKDDANSKLLMANFGDNVPCKIIGDDLNTLHCKCSQATIIYGSKRPDLYPFIDLEEYYTYSGEVTVENVVYYKWLKQGDVNPDTEEPNIYILTTTRDFSTTDFNNPYVVDGYYAVDETGYEYPDSSFHIYYGDIVPPTKLFEIEHHDTSILDANNVEYVDLGLPSGALWATMNINAKTDSINSYYGEYFAFGATTGYTTSETHNFNWTNCPFNNNSDTYNAEYFLEHKSEWINDDNTLKLNYDAARSNLGGDWHMPNTKLLCELLLCTKKNEWVENYNNITGLNGRLFTGNNGNTLFIPASGYRSGSNIDSGYYFDLWGSILDSADPGTAGGLFANAGSFSIYFDVRYYGFAVRGVLY